MTREQVIEIIESIETDTHAEGCGLEDQGITDRYEAMEYGWGRAISAIMEAIEMTDKN